MKRTDKLRYTVLMMITAVIFVSGNCEARGRGPDPASLLTIEGVILHNSPGSFILRSDNGQEAKYNTGRETRFVPADFRSRNGDQVKVTYYMKDLRDQTVAAVSELELVAANTGRREPGNPASGTVVEIGKKFYQIFVPVINDTVRFDTARGLSYTPSDWKPSAGQKVKVSYNLVPARWGNYYVYEITSFELVE